jgi:hypothetical protein
LPLHCGIENVTAVVEFTEYVIAPNLMRLEFKKFKYNSEYCQEFYGETLTYKISKSKTDQDMQGNDTLWDHIDKMATCSSINDTCSFTAHTNGTHGEKVYIWAHHNGKLNETKPTEMFKIRACTIANVIPGVPF